MKSTSKNLNLSVKIKKEEEDSVLYISCSGEQNGSQAALRKLATGEDPQEWDDTISAKTWNSNDNNNEECKIKECRHRQPRSDNSDISDRNRTHLFAKKRCMETTAHDEDRHSKEHTFNGNELNCHDFKFDTQSEKRFKCNLCNSKFTRRSSLNRHMECIHRELQGYECGLCSENVSTRPIRDKYRDFHLKREKLYRCTTCEKAFLYPEMLIRHKSWHKKLKDKDIYRCFVCNLSFKDSQDLDVHNEQLHSTRITLSSDAILPECCGSENVDESSGYLSTVPRISNVYSVGSKFEENNTRTRNTALKTISRSGSEGTIVSSREYNIRHRNHEPEFLSPPNSLARRTYGVTKDSVSSGARGVEILRTECTDKFQPLFRKYVNSNDLRNGPPEVRTKSSLKRKLLYSLATRREVAFANLRKKTIGFMPSLNPIKNTLPKLKGDALINSSKSGNRLSPISSLHMNDKNNTIKYQDVENTSYHKMSAQECNMDKPNPSKDLTFRKDEVSGDIDRCHIIPPPGLPPTDIPVSNIQTQGSSPGFKDHPDNGRDFDEVYECPKCGKDYQACRYMETHLLLHDDTTDMPCHFCTKKFISKKDLERHVHTRHAPKQRLVKKTSSQLSRTLKEDVEQINRVLSSAESTTHESPVTEPTRIETYEGKQEEMTGKDSSVPESQPLADHSTNKTTTCRPAASQSGNNFKCGFCSQTFSIPSELEEHIYAHFMSKPYLCALCSEAFTTIRCLEQHLHDHKESVL